MRKLSLLILFFVPVLVFAQPVNDECNTALDRSNNFCSNGKEYTNSNARSSFTNTGPDVWFKFTALDYNVNVTVTGGGNGGIRSPVIALYSDCGGIVLAGSIISANDITTFHAGGLIIGKSYLIQIGSTASNTGSFSLCINNYKPVPLPGQDYNTASYLCSKETFTQQSLRGAGNDNDEAKGTCLGQTGVASEKNSVWYKWTAANNGTLTFTITPIDTTNDIDWVLYDLGVVDRASINGANVMRCAAGHGVRFDSRCPNDKLYHKTGMNLTSIEFSEESGCGHGGQDGFVKYIDMEPGHIYALLINNWTDIPANVSEINNGFSISFGGTGEFTGPKASIDFKETQPCTPSQSFTFNSLSTNYSSLKWTFGDDASIASATTEGPFTITYATPGTKTAVLEAYGANGCYTIDVKTFEVGETPATPVINANKLDFCLLDTIKLSTPEFANVTYHWTGPDNFEADGASVNIPIISLTVAGTYTLFARQGNCISPSATITIPPVLPNPIAAFRTSPVLPAKLAAPVVINFFNQSVNADGYLWDFGDGNTSTEVSPQHEYTALGSYKVTLTAFQSNVCSISVIKGTFVILDENTVFVPNTFTPNSDNINDEFVVTIPNLQSYRIRIYNRWGSPVFESADIFDNWKGLYNGQPVPTGVYYYAIEALGINNNMIRKSGYVTVLR